MSDETTTYIEDGYVVPDGLAALGAIDHELFGKIPFNPGERVAFQDILHPEQPELDHAHAGMYGIVKAIGFADGGIRLDLLVFDPSHGPQETDSTIYRARMGELQ